MLIGLALSLLCRLDSINCHEPRGAMKPLCDQDVISPYTEEGTLNQRGQELFEEGKRILQSESTSLGLVILSGGEGTRLGLKCPKGLFSIEEKPIFEWHISCLRDLHSKYGTKFYLFIMTSRATHDQVAEYFANKQFDFLQGLDIFQQDTIDVKNSQTGEPMLLSGEVIKSPSGNGEFYDAIKKAKNWKKVDAFNVISVDNVLANILDEVFVGAFYASGLDILSKAVMAHEKERVGAFFKLDNHIKIREYSDNNTGDSDPSPLGNICNHLFSADFVGRVNSKELPLHEVLKKITHTNGQGELVVPKAPNGIKSERFIFDSFHLSSKSDVLSVPRELEFGPLKNDLNSATDNVITCTEALKRRIERGRLSRAREEQQKAEQAELDNLGLPKTGRDRV